MDSKIGIHSIIGPRKNFGEYLKRIVEAGAKIPMIKCVDDFGPAKEAKALDPDTLTVGRLNVGYDDQGNRVDMQAIEPKGRYEGSDGAALAAHDYYAIAKIQWDKNPQIDIWETFNEFSFYWDWQGMFYIAMMDLVEKDGFTLAHYGCSSGNPPGFVSGRARSFLLRAVGRDSDWAVKMMLPCLREAKKRGHYLSLHEYGGVGMDIKTLKGTQSYHALRYRELYEKHLIPNDADPPLLLTEIGQAGGFDYLGAKTLVDDMRWYDSELARDDYVKGAAIFTLGKWYQSNFQAGLPPLADYIIALKGDSMSEDPVTQPQTRTRGAPRLQYKRTYLLLPNEPDTTEGNRRLDEFYSAVVASKVLSEDRWTVGTSADDGGIGDLDVRRVVAVNPASWPSDLQEFFEVEYPYVKYGFIEADTPDELRDKLLSNDITWPDDTKPQPEPPAPPPPADQLLLGLHLYSGGGGVRDVDFDVLRTARITDTCLITTNSGPQQMQRLIDFGIPASEIILRLFVDWPSEKVDPVKVYGWFGHTPGMAGNPDDYPLTWFRQKGGKRYVIFNEPNLESEGFGVQWQSAEEFTDFYSNFAALALRDYPELEPGLPALSPKDDVKAVWIPAYEEVRAYARWVSAHCYWRDGSLLAHTEHGFYWKNYEPIGLPIDITECSNNNGQVALDKKAQEYIQYVEALAAAGFGGRVIFYLSSSSLKGDFERAEPWVDRQGQLTVIPRLFGERGL